MLPKLGINMFPKIKTQYITDEYSRISGQTSP